MGDNDRLGEEEMTNQRVILEGQVHECKVLAKD